MFLPCLNLSTCLICLPFWSKVHSKPTTAIFTSGSSTSMTFERMGKCDFACDRRIGVVVNHATPHCHSSNITPSQGTSYVVSYAVHTSRTPMVKIICHSITADTLWVRKVCYRYVVASLHTPHIRDRYSYRIAISYHASSHERTTFLRRYFPSYGVRVMYVWQIEAATNVWRFFLNMFEIIVTPFPTCKRGDRAAYQLR